MKKSMLAVVFFSLAVTGCETGAAVLNVDKTPYAVTQPGRDVGAAIESALTSRGWKVTNKQPGQIDATLAVRIHRADISVLYDDKTYSIVYRGSENLEYNAEKGTIHRNYNRWVNNLDMDIKSRL